MLLDFLDDDDVPAAKPLRRLPARAADLALTDDDGAPAFAAGAVGRPPAPSPVAFADDPFAPGGFVPLPL